MVRRALWAALAVFLAVAAPAWAAPPVQVVTVLSTQADPCPGATLCGDFTKSAFKGFGVITSRFAGIPNLTVTRASGAYGENPDGSLVWFQPGQARATPKGLGVFEATTNLLTWSQDFTNAAWTKSGVTASGDVFAAPDGAVTADKLAETSANSGHGVTVASGITVTANTTYTFQTYLHAAERTKARVIVFNTAFTSYFYANVDLTACSVDSSGVGGSGVLSTVLNASKSNGWCWFSISGKIDTTSTSAFPDIDVRDPTGATSYTGSAGSGIYAWGADLRAGVIPVPHCPTAGGTATCAADIVSIALTNPAAYTVAARALLNPSTGTTPYQYLFDFASTSNTDTQGYVHGGDAIGRVVNGGIDQAILDVGLQPQGAVASLAVRVAANNFAASGGGRPVVTDVSGAVPASTALLLGGQLVDLTGQLDGYLQSFALYPTGLSDGTLQAYGQGTDLSSLSLNFAAGLYKNAAGYVRTNYAWPSNDPTNANWTKTNTTAALLGGAVCPADGVSPVYRVTATANNGRLTVAGPIANLAIGTAYVVSSTVRTAASDVAVRAFDGGNGLFTSAAVSSANAFARTFATRTVAASATGPGFDLLIGTSGETADLCFTQVEPGSYPSSYVATTSAAASVATTQSTNPADVGALSFTGGPGYAPDCNGNLVSFAANNPRITCAGVLIEEARTNSLVQSNSFGTTWQAQQASVSGAATTAPDGTLTAWKVIEDSSTNFHGVRQGVTVANATAYSFAVYLKAAERTWAYLERDDVGTGGLYINLATCAAGASVGLTSFALTPMANGWCRAATTRTTDSTTATYYITTAAANSTQNYAGNGSSGIYIWQADLQAGAFINSPILTTSATVTRPADVMSYAYAQAPSSTGLTLLAKAQTSVAAGVRQTMVSADDGTSNNAYQLAVNAPAVQALGQILSGGVSQFSPVFGTTTTGQFNGALRWATGPTYGASINGQTVQTGNTGTLPTTTTLRLGDTAALTRTLNGNLQNVTVLPYAANDNELAYRSAGNF